MTEKTPTATLAQTLRDCEPEYGSHASVRDQLREAAERLEELEALVKALKESAPTH